MPKNDATSKFFEKHWGQQDASTMFTKDGYQRLRAYLSVVQKGQPKVYTAPFAKGQSIAKVLADWNATLCSIQDEWPSLFQFENDLAKKVGPMSVMKPMVDRLADVAHYYEDILLSSTPINPEAIQAVQDEFSKLRGLRVRSQRNTVELMKKSTNSGSPYFTKRRNVVQDTIPANVRWSPWKQGPEVRQELPGFSREACAVIGWRGQEGGPSEEDVKQRVVWMFPFAVNVRELQVYQPLIEGCQKLNLVPAWVGMDAVDDRVTALFDTKAPQDLVVCTDFTRFDQHFNSDMQYAAESILRSVLTPNLSNLAWIEDVFPIKYMIPLVYDFDEWDADVGTQRTGYKHVETTLVECFRGRHGMGSGSGGTNADETLTHRAMQYEVAMAHNERLNPNSMCLGDDGILTYPGITVEDVVDSYSSHGQECNPEKQYASTQDCVFLRRWHHKDYRREGRCVGVYSTCRAIGRLRFLERFMDPEYWSPELVALRQLSIIENCKWHPLFHEFIEFCMKRDKYRLGLDLNGFFDNLTKLAIEATDHVQDFLGYTKTLQGEGPEGIANWEVVK